MQSRLVAGRIDLRKGLQNNKHVFALILIGLAERLIFWLVY